jgi:D-arabinose 5-phosphate isomerase GutQ
MERASFAIALANMTSTSKHPFLLPPTPAKNYIRCQPTFPWDSQRANELACKPNAKATSLALRVISTERAALSYLETFYSTNNGARESLSQSITITVDTSRKHGNLIITGVGKSGKIGQKLVATFNSLGVQSCFLHPTEALHGDLGIIRPYDTVLILTSSGRTPELILLLQHIPLTIPLIVLTSCSVRSTCEIVQLRPSSILLPAPVHEPEKVSFGLPVPTTSTIALLAVGDGLALATADLLYTPSTRSPAEVFQRNHPGGAKPPVPMMPDLPTKIEA